MSEVNKEQAEKAFQIGKKYMKAGNYVKALKMFNKANSMHPIPGCAALSAKMAKLISQSNASSSSSSNSRRASTSGQRSSGGNKIPRARAQTTPTSKPPVVDNNVKKILNCKDFYEVLGVSTKCTSSELKKAYRKLSLKFHPDKNKTPGADEAFKYIARAYQTLSDPKLKREYDLGGGDETSFGNNNSSSQRRNGGMQYRRRHNSHYEEELTPEDLFNMFFGGGTFRQDVRRRRSSHGQSNQREARHEQGGIGPAQLLQLLPLFLLILSSFLSMPTQKDPLFSMSPTRRYNVKKETQKSADKSIIVEVPFYLKSDWKTQMGSTPRERRENYKRVQLDVQTQYVRSLSHQCQVDQQRRRMEILRVRQTKTPEYVRRVMEKYKIPSYACENFHKIQTDLAK
jgi:curved DNA-binding protein CbpA